MKKTNIIKFWLIFSVLVIASFLSGCCEVGEICVNLEDLNVADNCTQTIVTTSQKFLCSEQIYTGVVMEIIIGPRRDVIVFQDGNIFYTTGVQNYRWKLGVSHKITIVLSTIQGVEIVE